MLTALETIPEAYKPRHRAGDVPAPRHRANRAVDSASRSEVAREFVRLFGEPYLGRHDARRDEIPF